jgi:hypothetical protein
MNLKIGLSVCIVRIGDLGNGIQDHTNLFDDEEQVLLWKKEESVVQSIYIGIVGCSERDIGNINIQHLFLHQGDENNVWKKKSGDIKKRRFIERGKLRWWTFWGKIKIKILKGMA